MKEKVAFSSFLKLVSGLESACFVQEVFNGKEELKTFFLLDER